MKGAGRETGDHVGLSQVCLGGREVGGRQLGESHHTAAAAAGSLRGGKQHGNIALVGRARCLIMITIISTYMPPSLS